MTYTAIVRARGQLTIPDRVRKLATWLRSGEAVGLEVDEEEVRIKPYVKTKPARYDWDKIWSAVRLARSFKGKRGNLSAMIAKDRESH